MKSDYSNYVMKMAVAKNIVNREDQIMGQFLDKYFSTNKVSMQLSVVPFHLLKFICDLNENSKKRGYNG